MSGLKLSEFETSHKVLILIGTLVAVAIVALWERLFVSKYFMIEKKSVLFG